MPLIAVAMCVVFYGIGIGPIPVSTMMLLFVQGSDRGLLTDVSHSALSLSLSRISSSRKCLMQNM